MVKEDILRIMEGRNSSYILGQNPVLGMQLSEAVVNTSTQRSTCCNPKGLPNPETTPEEIRSFYLYEAANAAFFVGTVDFISIYTVSQAQEYAQSQWCHYVTFLSDEWDQCMVSGWAIDYEHKGKCIEIAGDFLTNTSCVLGGGVWQADWIPEAASVPLFGMNVGYAATYTTASTVSIVFQLLLLVLFGSTADYGNLRKLLFLSSNVIGAVAIGMIYFGSESSSYEYNLLCFVVAQTMLNFAIIFYNAWLPLLVESHPTVKTAKDKFKARGDTTAKIAGKAVAFNFSAAIVFLLIAVFMLQFLGPTFGKATVIRWVCVVCAVWLLVFTIFCYRGLETRPGPPLPSGERYTTIGAKRMYGTFAKRKHLPQLFRFLFAYFIYSDGVSTMIGASAVFASIELHMGFSELIAAYFVVCLLSGFSAWFASWFQAKFNVAKKTILIVNLSLIGLLPIYAMVGLRMKMEYFVLVAVFSLNYGSVTVLTRSLYSSLIPRGHEAEFFSLYQLTDKGTAWLGPLTLTIVSSKTGSFRDAFSCLVAFFYVGIFFLLFFDVHKATSEKYRYEKSPKYIGTWVDVCSSQQDQSVLVEECKSFIQTQSQVSGSHRIQVVPA